jgi:hypothetical protein
VTARFHWQGTLFMLAYLVPVMHWQLEHLTLPRTPEGAAALWRSLPSHGPQCYYVQ